MQITIQNTADGSQTLYVESLDEHYHSTKGALTESTHIFINMGLLTFAHNESPSKTNKDLNNHSIKVLEVGFGTGLNALLTYEVSQLHNLDIHYTSLERYPLNSDIVSQMQYPHLTSTDLTNEYLALHQAAWNQWTDISTNFHLRKLNTDLTLLNSLQTTNNPSTTISSTTTPYLTATNFPSTAPDHTYNYIEEKYDIIYFDAFAPEKQPEMWTPEIFNALFTCLNQGGTLVTYCAKGSIRRMLQSTGFLVERLPGPPSGKREILRAIKP